MSKINRKRASCLAAGDMEILQVLWTEGPGTIAVVHKAMDRPIGYTTVQTKLNRLVDKGLVRRGKTRPARYSAAVKPEEIGSRHLDVLIERVTGGSIVPLVAHLVRDHAISREEMAELKRLIKEAERNIILKQK